MQNLNLMSSSCYLHVQCSMSGASDLTSHGSQVLVIPVSCYVMFTSGPLDTATQCNISSRNSYVQCQQLQISAAPASNLHARSICGLFQENAQHIPGSALLSSEQTISTKGNSEYKFWQIFVISWAGKNWSRIIVDHYKM